MFLSVIKGVGEKEKKENYLNGYIFQIICKLKN